MPFTRNQQRGVMSDSFRDGHRRLGRALSLARRAYPAPLRRLLSDFGFDAVDECNGDERLVSTDAGANRALSRKALMTR